MSAATVLDVAELTPELISAALGADVTEVDVAPVGIGNMSGSYRLRLTYADPTSLPDSLIAKIPSAQEDVRATNVNTYRLEVSFYADIAPRVRCAAPRAYSAASNADDNGFLLLLEDLSPAEPVDQLTGCTFAQARDAVANLAGLHASTWNEPWVGELGYLTVGTPARAIGAQGMLAAALPGFVERYALDAADIAILDAYAASLAGGLMAHPDRRALTHGDYRSDNLMFDPRPDATRPVLAIDWANIGIGLPARDLACFLATSLPTDLRRAHERELVAVYHRECGRDAPHQSLEQTWDDYVLAMFQPLLLTVFGAVMSQRSERGDALFHNMITRTIAAIRDLDAQERLPRA